MPRAHFTLPAMDDLAFTITGLPPELQALAVTVIGLLAGKFVQPATALLKKLGCTSGRVTVWISFALSALLALLLTLLPALASGSRWDAAWQAGLVGLIAFIKANGDYLARVFAAQKAGAPGAGPAPLPSPPAAPAAPTLGQIISEAMLAQPYDLIQFDKLKALLAAVGLPIENSNMVLTDAERELVYLLFKRARS